MIKDCHVGVKGIICVRDACLVVQKGIGDESFWEVPGGRIDNNESLEETLARELKEEVPSIGDFSIKDIIGAYRLHIDIEGERGLVLIFYRVEADDFDVVLSTEHSDYRWVTKDNLSEFKNREASMRPELYGYLEKVLG